MDSNLQPAPEPVPSPAAVSITDRSHFSIATWVFLRLLAIIHLIAFGSFWVQMNGLIGPNGILPATRYFEAVRDQLGPSGWRELPSLCWIFGAQGFLHVLCAGGVACALLLFVGVAPGLCLVFLWFGYLSLSAVGQIFLGFQWDTLLLETTLLAAFLAPWSLLPLWRRFEPRGAARFLLWWLLFRLMFLAGVVKLASGDPRWRDLSALTFHYETQPLPTVFGWYAHQLPAWWHRASCAGMFAIELLVPFFLFASRTLRHNAALILAGFMVLVALTGNYTFFNLLAIALCLLCLDDAFFLSVLPMRLQRLCKLIDDTPTAPARWGSKYLVGIAVAVVAFTTFQAIPIFLPRLPPPPGFNAVDALVGPFRSLNNYGLFAVMTNPRPELVFEGSDDGRDWKPYEFPDKPGDLSRHPTWVAPHQPRLDWQLWFAALGEPSQNRWVFNLCEDLLQGNPAVLALFSHNPFPDKPPRSIRVVRYEYHFTDLKTRRETGQWWRRTPLDFYVEPASLR